MKALIGLSLVQTALLVYLVIGASHPVRQSSPPEFKTSRLAAATGTFDEQKLRQVVGDEVRSQLAAFKTRLSATDSNASPPPVHRDIAEDTRLRDQVAQQIETYRSVGQVSNQEMQRLQSEVARLAPADRQQMMSRLARAINAQEIKVRTN